MTWTIDSALADELITVLHRDDDAGIYQFQLGVLETGIEVVLRLPPGGRWVEYTQSHAIKTPTQAAAYHSSRMADDTVGRALHKAICGFTQYYSEAVKAGHTPSEAWLLDD